MNSSSRLTSQSFLQSCFKETELMIYQHIHQTACPEAVKSQGTRLPTTHLSDRPAQKQLHKSQGCDSLLGSSPYPKAVETHAACEHPAQGLPLWLLPLRLVVGTARESIGLPLMVSRSPKPCCSAKHSSTLLQLLVDHTPFICHIKDCSILRLGRNIIGMCRTRWIHAYVEALVQPKSTCSTTHDQLLWQTGSECQCKLWLDVQPKHSWSQAPTWLITPSPQTVAYSTN